LLELLFFCVDAWSPRIRYCPVPGLPIEPNDVSRIIAHNYIKGVDEHFVNDPAVTYLRWVDDTVVFVADEEAAHEVKRRHHLALREMGLSPNASKTRIASSHEFATWRHPDVNLRIKRAKEKKDDIALRKIIGEWYAFGPDKKTNWKRATRVIQGFLCYGRSARFGSSPLTASVFACQPATPDSR
jgi:hypothetical protein